MLVFNNYLYCILCVVWHIQIMVALKHDNSTKRDGVTLDLLSEVRIFENLISYRSYWILVLMDFGRICCLLDMCHIYSGLWCIVKLRVFIIVVELLGCAPGIFT